MIRETRTCPCSGQMNTENVQEVENENMQKEELLSEIRCHEFAITELALYLDTHPTDKKALHKKIL